VINDRAIVAANTVLQIVTDAEQEQVLVPGELQFRLWRYLREEFDDSARQIAGEQQQQEGNKRGPCTRR
jgi:hypothetical protein